MLTEFGLIISTIISSLTGGAGGAVGDGGSPPKHPNKLKEWFKNKLKALGRLLCRIAGKAAAALPGIIGSIIYTFVARAQPLLHSLICTYAFYVTI